MMLARAVSLARERPALVGAAWLFIAVNIGNVLAYGYQVAMLRLLSPSDFSILVSLFAALIIESQGIQLVQNAAAKIVADRRAVGDGGAIVGFVVDWGRRVALVVFVPAALIGVAAPFVAGRIGFPAATVVMLGVSLFFAALFAFAAGVLQGLGRFGWLGAVLISQAGARLVLGVVLVVAGIGVVGAFAGATAAIALSFLGAALVLRRALAGAPAGRAPAVGGFFLGAAVVLFFYAALVNVDALLAPLLLPHDAAGAYAAAVTMGKIALFAPLGLSMFLLERTASAHAVGRPTVPTLVAVLGAVALVSGAVALLYLAAPAFVTRIVAGDAYVAATGAIVGTYGIAALSNAFLNVWIAYFIGVGRLRVGALFAVAVVVLVLALRGASDPLAMARTVLAVSLATQAAVVALFLVGARR